MKPSPKIRLIRPSTQAFFQEARHTPGFSLFDLLHGYFYARWPYFYIRVGTGEHPLVRRIRPILGWFGRFFPTRQRSTRSKPVAQTATFADTYHGKVVPLQAARELVTVGEEIRLPNLERVIPYRLARDIILQDPGHIVVLDCPCRAARANPCQPLDVCLIVGEPFASFASEHHPHRSRRITSQEAIAILEAEDRRGHVHHAFFKDAMLGRFYAICNCCSCCCGAIQAHRNGTPMLASSGYVAQVSEELCLACGVCADSCTFGAISVDELAMINTAICMGCGICLSQCAQGALTLVQDESKGEPLEIFRLMDQASRLVRA
jgi:ferredoxin